MPLLARLVDTVPARLTRDMPLLAELCRAAVGMKYAASFNEADINEGIGK